MLCQSKRAAPFSKQSFRGLLKIITTTLRCHLAMPAPEAHAISRTERPNNNLKNVLNNAPTERPKTEKRPEERLQLRRKATLDLTGRSRMLSSRWKTIAGSQEHAVNDAPRRSLLTKTERPKTLVTGNHSQKHLLPTRFQQPKVPLGTNFPAGNAVFHRVSVAI